MGQLPSWTEEQPVRRVKPIAVNPAPWKKYMKLSLEELRAKYDKLKVPEDADLYPPPSIDDDLFSYDGVMRFCCGIVEIGEFESDEGDIPEALPFMLAYQFRQAMDSERVRTLMATTVKSQPIATRWLKNFGFKAVDKTINPKTSNEITVWLYTEK